MSPTLEKFDIQGNPETRPDVGTVAEKRKDARPRPHVMDSYLASHEKFAPLYNRLAE
jgi:hypothetical protein